MFHKIFWQKDFSFVYYINWPNLLVIHFSFFMLGDFMTSWHLNIWKVKVWLPQERKELLKWNKNYFSLFLKCSFRNTKQTRENVAETAFKEIVNLVKNETIFQNNKLIANIFNKYFCNIVKKTICSKRPLFWRSIFKFTWW